MNYSKGKSHKFPYAPIPSIIIAERRMKTLFKRLKIGMFEMF